MKISLLRKSRLDRAELSLIFHILLSERVRLVVPLLLSAEYPFSNVDTALTFSTPPLLLIIAPFSEVRLLFSISTRAEALLVAITSKATLSLLLVILTVASSSALSDTILMPELFLALAITLFMLN